MGGSRGVLRTEGLGRGKDLDEHEGVGAAVGTTQGVGGGWRFPGRRQGAFRDGRRHVEERSRLGQATLALAVAQETIVPDLDEARRQQVQPEATQELLQRQGQRFEAVVVGVILVGESDGVVTSTWR